MKERLPSTNVLVTLMTLFARSLCPNEALSWSIETIKEPESFFLISMSVVGCQEEKGIEVKLKAFRNHSLKCITGAEEGGCHHQESQSKIHLRAKTCRLQQGRKGELKIFDFPFTGTLHNDAQPCLEAVLEAW